MWRKSILLTAIVTLTGCMTTEARWSTDDVLSFQTDCADSSQQEMLESQRVSRDDSFKSNMLISSVPGTIMTYLDGTYNERRKIRSGERSNAQRLTEYFREKQCLQQKVWSEQ